MQIAYFLERTKMYMLQELIIILQLRLIQLLIQQLLVGLLMIIHLNLMLEYQQGLISMLEVEVLKNLFV